MRKFGYLLVIVGFAAVMMQASGRLKHAAWVAREQREALPQQDSFTRKQVEDAIFRAAFAARQSDTAAVLPGFIILCGSLLLAGARTNRKEKAQ